MKNKTYQAYNDPSHGWLKVPMAELVELGIADKISGYSYQRGADAYLEEDMDASTFITAKGGKDAVKIKDNYCDGNSRIRSYAGYESITADGLKERQRLLDALIAYHPNWSSIAVYRLRGGSLFDIKRWADSYGVN